MKNWQEYRDGWEGDLLRVLRDLEPVPHQGPRDEWDRGYEEGVENTLYNVAEAFGLSLTKEELA